MENTQEILEEVIEEVSNVNPEIVSKEQDENPDIFIEGTELVPVEEVEPVIETKAISTVMSPTVGVNKSGYARYVRSGAGTSYSAVAKMGVNESFIFTGRKQIGSDGYEWWEIRISSSITGGYAKGWYQGATGVGFWKNNELGSKVFYGDSKVSTATGIKFKVIRTCSIKYGSGGTSTTLAPGDYIYAHTDCRVHGGAGQEDFLKLVGYERTNAGSGYSYVHNTRVNNQWQDLEGYWHENYIYADLGLIEFSCKAQGNWTSV